MYILELISSNEVFKNLLYSGFTYVNYMMFKFWLIFFSGVPKEDSLLWFIHYKRSICICLIYTNIYYIYVCLICTIYINVLFFDQQRPLVYVEKSHEICKWIELSLLSWGNNFYFKVKRTLKYHKYRYLRSCRKRPTSKWVFLINVSYLIRWWNNCRKCMRHIVV